MHISDFALKCAHSILVAIVLSGVTAWVLYGGASVYLYHNLECTSPFYNDLVPMANGVLGLFVCSAFVIITAALLRPVTPENANAAILQLGLAGFVMSGVLTLEIILGSACTVPAAVVAVDESVGDEYIQATAGLTIAVSIAIGILNFDFRRDENSKRISFSLQSLPSYIVNIARLVFFCFMARFADQSGNDLWLNHVDVERLNSEGCIAARAIFANQTESALYKNFYKPLRFASIDQVDNTTAVVSSVKPNDTMLWIAAWAIGASIFGTACALIGNFMYRDNESLARTFNFFSKFFILYEYIAIGLAASTLLLTSEIVSCTFYNTSSELVRGVYVMIGVVLWFSIVHILLGFTDFRWTRPWVYGDKDSDESDKQSLLNDGSTNVTSFRD
jgi:hypothetical protein